MPDMRRGMIPIKRKLNYRKATKEEPKCKHCRHFIPLFQVRGIGGNVRRIAPRCREIGLENSIRYQVNAVYTCDVWACVVRRKQKGENHNESPG